MVSISTVETHGEVVEILKAVKLIHCCGKNQVILSIVLCQMSSLSMNGLNSSSNEDRENYRCPGTIVLVSRASLKPVLPVV